MPSTCCVPKCRGNYSAGGPKVSTYKFPKDEALRKKWIFSIRRKDFTVTDHSRVCELHFKETDFEREVSAFDSKTGKTLTAPLSVKRLKKGVVPSLYINSKASKSTSSSNRETPERRRSRLEKEQLSLACEQSLKSAPSENSLTEDVTETSSNSRAPENEVTNSVKRKGIKRKGISDKEVSLSKDVNGFTGISYSIQQSPSQSNNANSSDPTLVNDSTLSMQNVQIKEEKPWEEEYNYTTNSSLNSDSVKITSVQSCASHENDASFQQETMGKPVGCDTTFYKKPLKIDKRDENFGKFVACEMSDLRTNPELYLKTQQSILKTLVEAHFEQMCAHNAV